MLPVIRFIRSLPGEEITLERVAEEFHYHPAYLSRRFSETTGVSFRKYAESLKIQRAKMQLLDRQSTVSVTEISGDSGFSFSNNFSSSFKKHTGISPRDYQAVSTRSYRFLRRFMKQAGELRYPVRPFPTKNQLVVDLQYPKDHEEGIHFVGLFPVPIPNQLPVTGVATHAAKEIRFSDVPDGTYYILACEVAQTQSFAGTFAMEDNFRGKVEEPLHFTGSTVEKSCFRCDWHCRKIRPLP